MRAALIALLLVLVVADEQEEASLRTILYRRMMVPGTRCLDGSTAGYYILLNPASTVWVISLQGGGGCTDAVSCAPQLASGYGSSTQWAASFSVPPDVLLDYNPANNPDFHAANMVYIPYCTGDLHSGQRINGFNGLFFAGHSNFVMFVQDWIANQPGFTSATNILLTGISAGGIGAYSHGDYLASILPAGVQVKVSANAGWWLPGFASDQLSDPKLPPNDYPDWTAGTQGGIMHQPALLNVYQMYLNPNCVLALGGGMGPTGGEAWLCASMNVLYNYTQVPVYAVNSMIDQYQVVNDMQSNLAASNFYTYLNYYQTAATHSMLQIPARANRSDGLFLVSCFTHYVYSNTTINGISWLPSLGDWFFGRNNIMHIVVDNCTSVSCNPNCYSSLPIALPPPTPSASAAPCISSSLIVLSVILSVFFSFF